MEIDIIKIYLGSSDNTSLKTIKDLQDTDLTEYKMATLQLITRELMVFILQMNMVILK